MKPVFSDVKMPGNVYVSDESLVDNASFELDLSTYFVVSYRTMKKSLVYGLSGLFFLGYGLAEDGWMPGAFCDEHFVCTAGLDEAAIQALFPDAFCETGAPCGASELKCYTQPTSGSDPDYHENMCELSLHPNQLELYCAVYGG